MYSRIKENNVVNEVLVFVFHIICFMYILLAILKEKQLVEVILKNTFYFYKANDHLDIEHTEIDNVPPLQANL